MNILQLQKEQKSNEDLYLPKTLELANSLFQAFINKNNVVGLKMLLLIGGAKEQIKWNHNKVNFSVDNLCNLINISKRDLSNNLQRVLKISFDFVDKDNNIGHTVPIHTYKYINNKKDIEIELSSEAKEILIELGKGQYSFDKANANNLMNLKHKHSIRLQLLLEQISRFTQVKRKRYTLNELNGFFGVKYRSYYELEQKILIPSKKEIDNNSSITFEYEFIDEKNKGTGRPKIKEVVIDIIEQGNYQARLI